MTQSKTARCTAAEMTPASRARAPTRPDKVSGWEDFYRVVRLIPAGRVTTYGAVAAFAGRPGAARQAGYAMAALKDSGNHGDVPWHRVLGAAASEYARVSIRDPMGSAMQQGLLEAEGVAFDDRGRVSLERFGWSGPGKRRRETGRR